MLALILDASAVPGSFAPGLSTEALAGGPKRGIKNHVCEPAHTLRIGSSTILPLRLSEVRVMTGLERQPSRTFAARSHPSARREAVMKQKHVLIGRITGPRMYCVPEFGKRASFTIECSGQCSVACCIAGDVAREFLASCREGDIVAVDGIYELHPSTASPKTPWVGRFRVRALRILESARIAA
jgi:hypothetical protein